jgi:hypothetical protein
MSVGSNCSGVLAVYVKKSDTTRAPNVIYPGINTRKMRCF